MNGKKSIEYGLEVNRGTWQRSMDCLSGFLRRFTRQRPLSTKPEAPLTNLEGIPEALLNKSQEMPVALQNKSQEMPDASLNKSQDMPDASLNKSQDMPDASLNKSQDMPDASLNKSQEMQKSFTCDESFYLKEDDEKPYADCVMKNRDSIVTDLKYVENILEYLVSLKAHRSISETEKDDILQEPNRRAKCRLLCDRLCTANDKCKYFIVALIKTIQANLLENSPLKSEDKHLVDVEAKDAPHVHPFLIYEQEFETYTKSKLKDYCDARTNIEAIGIEKHQPRVMQLEQQAPKELKRTGVRELEEKRKQGKAIELKDVFGGNGHAYEAKKRILLLGDPGMGKTALCYQILLQKYKRREWNEADRLIFHIPLRDIVYMNDQAMSLKKFLLNFFGPDVDNIDETWKELEAKQSKLLILLDGYDEVEDFMKQGIDVKKSENEAKPFTLLRNLLTGNLLPDSRVLVTSRQHRLESIRKFMHKDRMELEIKALERDQVNELVTDVLDKHPKIASAVCKYLDRESDMASLCETPVHIQGLLRYISIKIKSDLDNIIKSMPRTKSELQWKLILSHLSATNRVLDKDHEIDDEEIIWMECRPLLEKVSNLAANGIVDGQFKKTFSPSEIRKHNISPDDLRSCGLFVTYKNRTKVHFLSNTETTIHFSHLTLQESCAALKIANSNTDIICKLVDENEGQLDVVLLYVVTLLSNPVCREVLMNIYPNTNKEESETKAGTILEHIVRSQRMSDNKWKIMVMSILHESQISNIDQYAPYFHDSPERILKYENAKRGDMNTIAKFISHLSTPYDEVHLVSPQEEEGFHNFATNVYYENSYGYKTLVIDYDPQSANPSDGMREPGPSFQHDNPEDTPVIHIKVKQQNPSLLDTILTDLEKQLTITKTEDHKPPVIRKVMAVKSKLEYSNVQDLLQRTCIKYITDLNLSRNKIGSSKNSCLEGIKELPKLTRLQLVSCSLTAEDLRVLVMKQLCFLDISDNEDIGDEGASYLHELLLADGCVLDSLFAADCGFTQDGLTTIFQTNNTSLKLLDISFEDDGDALPEEMNLTGLEELYARRLDIRPILPALKSLRCLDIIGCEVVSEDIQAIFDNNKPLQAMKCDWNMFPTLLKVCFKTSLKSLTIKGGDFESSASEALCEFLRREDIGLEELWLYGQLKFSDETWEDIAESLSTSKLHKIGIWPSKGSIPEPFVKMLQKILPPTSNLKHVFVEPQEKEKPLEKWNMQMKEHQNKSDFYRSRQQCPEMPSTFLLTTVAENEKMNVLKTQSSFG